LKPHFFHPEAAEEYAAAAEYYFQIEPALGERFYDEIERLIETVCRKGSVQQNVVPVSVLTIDSNPPPASTRCGRNTPHHRTRPRPRRRNLDSGAQAQG